MAARPAGGLAVPAASSLEWSAVPSGMPVLVVVMHPLTFVGVSLGMKRGWQLFVSG